MSAGRLPSVSVLALGGCASNHSAMSPAGPRAQHIADLLLMFVIISAVVYLLVISRSPFRVPCLALLNTLILFCLFNNMLVSAAIIPQLIWPLLLPPWGWWKRKAGLARPQA